MASYFTYLKEWLKRDKEAQLEAVKRLGLPANNTAQDRARAMGFSDETYYHGSVKDFDEFDPNMSYDEAYLGKSIYVTDNPADASRNYANIDSPDLHVKANSTIEELPASNYLDEPEWTPKKKEWLDGYADNEGIVYPLSIRKGNQLDLTKKPSELNEIDNSAYEKGRQGYDAMSLRNTYKDMGYDSVKIDANKEFGGLMHGFDNTNHTMLFNPANIRSPLAHFNPKYAGIGAGSVMSGNLMANELDLEHKPKPSMFQGLMNTIGNVNQQQTQAYGDTGAGVASGVGSLLADPSVMAEIAVRGVAGIGLGGLLMSNDIGSAEDPRFLERLR